MKFYKRWIGDYQRDTQHLSLAEHGAYGLMLDIHYATEKPLPRDRDAVYRLLRAVTKAEQAAVDAVLSQFWTVTSDGWVNGKAADVMAEASERSEQAREAARQRWAENPGRSANASSDDANAPQDASPDDANASKNACEIDANASKNDAHRPQHASIFDASHSQSQSHSHSQKKATASGTRPREGPIGEMESVRRETLHGERTGPARPEDGKGRAQAGGTHRQASKRGPQHGVSVMIDQDVFNIEWAVICERCNRDPSQVLAARYYQSLSPRMTTDEFRVAARVVFEEREFLPKPAEFLEAVRPSVEAEALEQWERCEHVMGGSKQALMRMSPTGRRTVQLLGGIDRLRNTKLDELQFVRRDFLKLFGDAEEIHRRENQPTALPVSDEARKILASAVPALLGGAVDASDDEAAW